MTWFATNIILENDDTNSQNFFLYSPSTTFGWYFLPWDYDGAWGFYDQPKEAARVQRPRWTEGVANWWNVVLHKRFLKGAGNIDVLVAKVQELRSFFTVDATTTMLDLYRDLVTDILTVDPDLHTLPALNDNTDAEIIAEWNAEVDRVPSVPEQKYQEFMDTLGRPMPVWLGDPELEDGILAFHWDESFDLQGDSITYDFQVSTTRNFDPGDIIYERLGRTSVSVGVDPTGLGGAGTYYYRVTIRDSEGNWQYPFDFIWVGGELFDGMKEFTVD